MDLLISEANGKDKLRVISQIAYNIANFDNNLYLKYSIQGLEQSLSQNDSLYISNFLIDIGYHYKFKGAYQDALNNFNRSKSISEKNGYKEALAAAYTGLGTVYHELNLYDRALQNHSKSLSLKEEFGNKRNLGVSYNNIGLIYYKIDDPQKALEYFLKSLNLKLEIGDTANCIRNYVNMGLAYSEISDEKSNEKAIESFRQATKLSIKYSQLYLIGFAYNGIAKVYIEQLKYDSAKHYLSLSIEESVLKDYKKLESSNYYLLAKISFQEKRYNLAINYLARSQMQIAKLKDKSRIKNNYGLYADIFEAKNMLDSAFYYQKKFSIMKDSIFNEELANNLANVQIATSEEQSQRKIADQEETIFKNKLVVLFLLCILALSIALIFVIFRNYANINKINKQLKESKNEIEAQKENLEKKNEQLAEAQVTIEKQNEVLMNINVDLDKKVRERTLELDRSYHELEKAVKDLDQFIYKTSHDLRGPIATMQGIINLGVIDAGDEKSREYFNTLHKVSSNLNNVLSRLIEVHETYQTKPILQKLDPTKEIIETANTVSQLSFQRNITIVTELMGNGPWISDKVLFNLIIENMLRNAMNYKDRGDSVIKIKTEFRDDNLKILFEDNGFGIQ
ncbi:MAG: tetratricopeptide repeat-containing sensor histidine kinase, partial [Cyclobacteriaceae bacterium]|nr:tetratricopeptide repeat-containing sensor histidine kinase [Cyclobacteriaceae bacterium]